MDRARSGCTVDASGVPMFVALDAETGELLGMHSFRTHRKEGWCYGYRLAIASSARREGIASRMLTYEAERIRQAGYRYLRGVTGTTAEWSVRWHLRNGYRIIGYYHSPLHPASSRLCPPQQRGLLPSAFLGRLCHYPPHEGFQWPRQPFGALGQKNDPPRTLKTRNKKSVLKCKNMSIACTLGRAIDIFMQKDGRLLRFVGYLL